jgi:hypothetical protein
MPGFNIDAYRANFQGGARSYLFYYKPMFPAGIGSNSEAATYLVRTASLPETSQDEIMYAWQGFDFKVAGKYTYSDWSVTFNCDAETNIQTYYHNWLSLIHDPTTNTYNVPANYMVDQQVELLGLDGKPTLKYKLYGAWPKSISQAQLDYTNNDNVQFDVTFTYIYHVTNNANYGVAPTFG